jgi:hypothetical protein
MVSSPRASDTRLDNVFFVIGGVAAVWLAYLLFQESFTLGWGQIGFSVLFWLLLAYLVLPRLHRILTSIYVPNYFIGRTRTSDGLLGDPVNLALLGSEHQLHAVMDKSNWTLADDVTLASGWRIVRSTLLRRSYLEAPVSPLLLFGRKQDFAYQQEVDGTPGKRHHVRFWRCPPGWMLPGGIAVEWLAAGTYDRSVGFSLFTLQVTHKIDEHTDVERDHIVASAIGADAAVTVSTIKDFSTGYHARNGGGDAIITDGDLPVLDLSSVTAPRDATVEAHTDSRDKRPTTTIVGSVFVAARAATTAFTAGAILLDWNSAVRGLVSDDGTLTSQQLISALVVIVAIFFAYAVVDIVLAVAVFLGHNWARVIAMVLSTVAIIVQAATLAGGGPGITLKTTLTGLALDILLVVALSSQGARIYARRATKAPKRISGRPGNAAAF